MKIITMENKTPTIKQLKLQIIELDKQIADLKNKSNWLDIPELNISVEIEVHDKDKSWDDLGLKDRESELLTYEQTIWLANSKYAKTLKMDGSSLSDDFFIQQPFNLSRKNGFVARFFAVSDGAGLNCYRNPTGSYSSLGVRFCRDIKTKEKNGR